MELPIFNDNLKSSGTWAAALARDFEAWRQATAEDPSLGLAVRAAQVRHLSGQAAPGLDDQRLAEAFEAVSRWATETPARFDLERLLELHRLLLGAAPADAILRTAAPPLLSEWHDPAPASLLPRMLELAFDWFTSPSFEELHPVEQATVVYLRLLDLHPFPAHMETTALLTAGFYTRRASFPMLVIDANENDRARFQQARDAAFRMLTQPLVELFADQLSRDMRSVREEMDGTNVTNGTDGTEGTN